ncbi:MAG: hypothetical protein KUG56_00495, partial [Kordiimonadaceae bacterium]|nr:hypothetical protein [Kordiimonadaceae bacterium]
FGKLDKNRNLALSEQEYRRVNFEDKSFVFHQFSSLDSDASGFIDIKEFTQVSHSEFRGLDQDDDCQLGSKDAAYSVVADRARGLGGKNHRKKTNRTTRPKVEELEPFEG